MNKVTNKMIKALALCVGFFSFNSCNENALVRPDLIPEVDNINTFELNVEDFDIRIRNYYEDSVRSDDYKNPMFPLGNINADPFFGKIFTGVNFQIAPPSEGYKFPEDMTTIDSVVLMIAYTGVVYGDSSANIQHKVEVSRIVDESFKVDNKPEYYVNSHVNTGSVLGSKVFSIQDLRDVKYVNLIDTVNNILMIKLDDAFKNEVQGWQADQLKDFVSFRNIFNGFNISTDRSFTGGGNKSLLYFNLSTGLSTNFTARLVCFYTNSEGVSKKESFPYKNVISAYFHNISNDITGFPVEVFMDNSINRDSVVVKGLPGLSTDIEINNLQQIGNNLVAKASFKLYALPVGEDAVFTGPNGLIIQGINPDGTFFNIPDYYDNSNTINSYGRYFVSGIPAKVMIDGREYLEYDINIPLTIQKSVKEGWDKITLRVNAGNLPGAYRLVARGPGTNTSTSMKFHLIYTKN